MEKETPTVEEWEEDLRAEMIKKGYTTEDIDAWTKAIRSLLSSHNAELARKIEGMKRDPHNDELTSSDVFVHNEALDAVLALLSTKK